MQNVSGRPQIVVYHAPSLSRLEKKNTTKFYKPKHNKSTKHNMTQQSTTKQWTRQQQQQPHHNQNNTTTTTGQ